MRSTKPPFLPLTLTLTLSLLLLFLAACAAPPPGSGGANPARSGNPAVQATISARQAQDAAATYDAALAVTRAAAQATEAARAQVTATAVAAATGTSLAVTGTAVAATATAADLSVQGTQIALVAVQTQNAIEAAATGTHQAASANAEMTAEALHIANARMLQEAERQRLAAQQQRQELLNAALPFLLILFALALLILAALFAYLMIRSRNPIYHVEHMGNKIAIIPTANGSYAPLPALTGSSAATLALPAPAPAPPAPLRPLRSPRASWRMFISHSDPATVPLGVNQETGQPVFLNRRQTPHLLIAGTTGAGKSASGLVPFVAGNWGNQAHVVVVNGRGSDFAPFAGQHNLTLWPAMRPLALIDPLAAFLTLLVEEMHRRDGVLARHGARNWSELPASAGESGELLLAIDEFLTVVDAAKEAAELARLSRDAGTARAMLYQVTVMWLRLITLTNEGRKAGIYLALTMTDPTREAIGERGMRLRRQMATIGFRMNSAASSRAFLDVSRADGLASGSVGLANGRFVYNISGEVGTAIGFYPDPADLARFFRMRPAALNPLPPALAAATAELGGAASAAPQLAGRQAAAPQAALPSWAVPGREAAQAAEDGEALRPYLAGLKSLNAAGSLLSDVTARPSGQFLRTRLKPALLWLREHGESADADRLLARFND
jgi:hypothetical protein